MLKLRPGKLYEVVNPIWIEKQWTNKHTHLMFIGRSYVGCVSLDFLTPSGTVVKFERETTVYREYSKILKEVEEGGAIGDEA